MGYAKLRLLVWSELCADLLRYGVRHLTLQLQDIVQIAVVRLGPQVLIRGCLEKLGGDTHSLARTNNRSFNDAVDVQFSRNFRKTLFGAFVSHDGCSRDDPQRADS